MAHLFYLFGWIVGSDTRKKEPEVDQVTKNLYVAMREGQKVTVAKIGEPPYTSIVFSTCGCGVPLEKGQGYQIKDGKGDLHVVDAIAIHHTACHRENLSEDELSLLAQLPEKHISKEEENLLHQLGKRYDIF